MVLVEERIADERTLALLLGYLWQGTVDGMSAWLPQAQLQDRLYVPGRMSTQTAAGHSEEAGRPQPLEAHPNRSHTLAECLLSRAWAGLTHRSPGCRMPIPLRDTHRRESWVREIRLSGSEGGVGRKP